MKNLILSILWFFLMMLFASCSSLKEIKKTEQLKEQTLDKSISELVRLEIDKQLLSINQTTIEYYPPELGFYNHINPPTPKEGCVVKYDSLSKRPKKPPASNISQPIKSITSTQINTQSNNITTTDSISKLDISNTFDSNLKEIQEDKPSNFTMICKWIAIALGLILILILILKLW